MTTLLGADTLLIITDTATQLLASFESLSLQEQHELLAQLLRRTGELPEAQMSDHELVAVADELFQVLDAEESNDDDADQR